MTSKQLKKLEAELWRAADQLRVNSKLTATQYSMPVLGLIFLRHAFNRFEKVKIEIEKNLPIHPQLGKKPIIKEDFLEKSAIFLPEKSRFDYLASLPESSEIGDSIDEAMKAIEEEYPNLAGVLPKNYSIFAKDLLKELLRIFNKEVLQKAEGDIFGKIYEYFLNKFAMTGAQEGGEFFTPFSLVNTIVNVIEPDHGTILDPACGSAGMFVQTGYFIESKGKKTAEKVTFYGQEKTETNTYLSKMNMAVHGLEGTIVEGNTFYEDKHNLSGDCDFVMANPPFNVNGVDKNKDFVKKDSRLKFGLPKNDNANYLWIQYFYGYLNKTGRAGFVMASSASDAGHSEKDIREKLVKTGAVDVMIAITNNFFYTRSLPCTLWFFDRSKETDKDKSQKVLMLDARKIYHKVTQKINDFSPEQLQNLICIVNLYRGNTKKFDKTLKNYLETSFSLAKETAEATNQLQKSIRAIYKTIIPFYEKLVKDNNQINPLISEIKVQTKETSNIYELQNKFIADANKAKPDIVVLENLAHQCKALRKPQDKLIKQLLDSITSAVKEYQFNKNKNWKELNLKEQLDHLKELQFQISGNPDEEEPGLLHETEYFWKQAYWLTSRFPNGKYKDFEGLCKVVTQKEVEDKDWSLSPGRYVGVDSAPPDDFDYEERLNEIHIELKGLSEEAIELANKISENYKELII
ncbi:MAG TPA: class I SAM-dependent DNA methyltransferase [Ignavibacteria bacterium]